MLTSSQRELLLQGEREIDERLLKGHKLRERLIFEAFYRTCPDFAGRPIDTWKQMMVDAPDIVCTDQNGKQIGLELSEWLNQEQMKYSKDRERMEDSFLNAIRSKEIPPPTNLGLVWLSTNSLTPLRQADAESFRKELLSLVESVDSNWGTNEDRESPQGYCHTDFSGYGRLGRYLGSLRFFPRSKFSASLGMPWVRFPTHGGAYSPQDAIDALREQLNKKTSKETYLDLHERQNLDELYLLLYYDQGWFYNTPFSAPEFGFRDVAEMVAQAAATNPGVFQKIFLFNSLYGDQEAVQLWPR